MRKRWLAAAILTAAATAGALVTVGSPDVEAAPRVRWLNEDNGPQPTMTTWDNDIAADRECWVIFNLQIQEYTGAAITVYFIEAPKQNSVYNDALWKWTCDGNGVSATGIPAAQQNPAVGYDNYVSASAFMSGGLTAYRVGSDTEMQITVTCKFQNAEDFGNDSDASEAPDAGDWTARLNLEAIGFN